VGGGGGGGGKGGCEGLWRMRELGRGYAGMLLKYQFGFKCFSNVCPV